MIQTLSSGKTILSTGKTTLWALYGFCQDFFTWSCPKDYLGCTCDGCLNQEICIRYKLTMKAVKQELKLREWYK